MSQIPSFTGMISSGYMTVPTPAWTGGFSIASGSVTTEYHTPRNLPVETEKLLLFVLEALASPTERGLLTALRDNPTDQATRNAYIDYLEEQGRPTGVALLKNNFVPGGKTVQ